MAGQAEGVEEGGCSWMLLHLLHLLLSSLVLDNLVTGHGQQKPLPAGEGIPAVPGQAPSGCGPGHCNKLEMLAVGEAWRQ